VPSAGSGASDPSRHRATFWTGQPYRALGAGGVPLNGVRPHSYVPREKEARMLALSRRPNEQPEIRPL
jgi:hypothetical protein